jgi:DNA-binding response OmpR family regulator
MTWHLAVVDDDPALHRQVMEQLQQTGIAAATAALALPH